MVMKTVKLKSDWRNLRSGLNRFLSILLIVALGSGFLAGLMATTPDMEETADRYYRDCAWYDLDVRAPAGMTDADTEALRVLEGIGTVQPARVFDLVLTDGGEDSWTCRVYGLPEEESAPALNRQELLSGRMPQRPGECVVQATAARYAGRMPTEGMTLTPASDENDTCLADGCLTVTGTVRSPMSISVEQEPSNVGNGSVGVLVFTPAATFDCDYWTDAFVALEGTESISSFAPAYDDLAQAAADRIRELGTERAPLRAEALRADAEEELAQARSLIGMLAETQAVMTALADDAGAGMETHARITRLLRDAGHAGLADAMAVTAPVAAEEIPLLTALRDTVEETETLLDGLDSAGWIPRLRADAVGFSSYAGNVEKIDALCRIFPAFFFLVALLVALTTMTRLVEENRGRIGTFKSLGVPEASIWAEFIGFSLAASVTGCVIGLLVGFRLFPSVIAGAYGMMYTLPETATPFRWHIALTVAPVTIGGILLATVWACGSVLRQTPAALLQPPAPKPGKRIWLEHLPFLWNRLPFSRKVTCRNLFRYKKRFIMTLVGVAGCSALLVTGFGLRDSINDIVEKQFGGIYRYQLTLQTTDENAAETDGALRAFLSDGSRISGWTGYGAESGRVSFGGRSETVSIGVPEDPDAFPAFIALRERVSGDPLSLTDGGVILTEKLCEQLGIRVGDTVTLEQSDELRGEIPVTGITENYITAFAYLTRPCYRAVFGRDAKTGTLLCKAAGDAPDWEALTASALSCPSVLYAGNTGSLRTTFDDSIKSIDAVILVLILAAGILCMVVEYNLTNVNICERKKELATIRVLGFRDRATASYIFRETNTLSFLGALCGLGVGVWLHAFVVRTVEVEAVMFGRVIHPLSFVYALAISVLFTLLVNRVMRRQILGVDMVEAMKAND